MSAIHPSPLPSAVSLLPLPSQSALRDAFVGQTISALRTPAVIVDRSRFTANSERVTREAERRGMKFRAHVKTHKTIDGVRIQAKAANGVKAFIASTLPEVHYLAHSGTVEGGLIDDILYSLPISADKLADLSGLQDHCGDKAIIRVMIDHPDQVKVLDAFAAESGNGRVWSCFVKVDGGGRRAGIPADSEQMKTLIKAAMEAEHVSIYGFYSHFGQSYASKTLSTATDFYHAEIDCVNTAAKVARGLGLQGDFILSVGATPTAHAATTVNEASLTLEGKLELHAGCYCLNDAQQLATSLIPPSACALTVLARVVSLYPGRGANGSPEAMTDCGALAVSKDTGPWAGYGRVVWPERLSGWDLGRVSQEHGTLVRREGEGLGEGGGDVAVGDLVRILPQHACLVCAAHPWIYVVEGGGETVVDVWVTWKGW